MSDEMKKLQSLYLYNFALRWIINRGYTYLYSFVLGIGMYRARSLYRGTFDIDVFCYVHAVEMLQVQINFWNIIYGEICTRNPNLYEPVPSMVRGWGLGAYLADNLTTGFWQKHTYSRSDRERRRLSLSLKVTPYLVWMGSLTSVWPNCQSWNFQVLTAHWWLKTYWAPLYIQMKIYSKQWEIPWTV